MMQKLVSRAYVPVSCDMSSLSMTLAFCLDIRSISCLGKQELLFPSKLQGSRN